MADTIVVIAAGEMGAGIGKRLSERGARVLTSMKGRSADSKKRAAAAGMQDKRGSCAAASTGVRQRRR